MSHPRGRANQPPASSSRGRLLRWLSWFAFLQGLIATAVATSYLHHVPFPRDWRAATFVLLALPSQFFTIVLLPFLVLGLVTLLLPSRRLLIGLATMIYGALLVLVLVDTRVFALHRFHLNAMVWNILAGGAASQILVFSTRDWILACGIALAAFALAGLSAFGVWRWSNGRRRSGPAVAAVVLAIMVATQSIHVWADAAHYTPILAQSRVLPWPQTLITAKRFLRRAGIEVQRAPVPEMRVEGVLRYPRRPMRCAEDPPRENLLLIVVEGLRYDMADERTMPNVHALGQDGWRFANHFSGGNASRFGIFSLFYGLLGSYWHAVLSEGREPVLMSAIRNHGFELSILASAPLSSPEFDRTVFVRLADRLEPPPAAPTVDQRDVQITKRFEERLRSAKGKPFFGFLFYDAPHKYAYPASVRAPFQPDLDSVSYVTLGPDTDPIPFVNRYRNSLHFVDGLIGELVELLRELDLYDETIIVVTGDHGQEFNETGQNYWGHNGNFSRYQVGVPLIIRWPGKAPRRTIHPTSHLDLVPTLMQDFFRCENAISDYAHGRHLLDDSPRDYVTVSSWSNSAIIHGKTVMVLEKHGVELRRLDDYSLQSDQTPDLGVLQAVMQSRSQFLARGRVDGGEGTN